jgi:hypothetical protein
LEHYLGSVLVAQKNYGEGLIHLYQALKFDRWDRDLRHDLEVAQSLVPENRGTSMDHPSEWAFTINSYVRAEEWYFLSALLLLILLVARFFKKLSRANWFYSGCFIFILFCLGVIAQQSHSFALFKKDTTIKKAAFDSAEDEASSPAGTRVRILRQNDTYCEVERVGSIRGWVPNSALFIFNSK